VCDREALKSGSLGPIGAIEPLGEKKKKKKRFMDEIQYNTKQYNTKQYNTKQNVKRTEAKVRNLWSDTKPGFPRRAHYTSSPGTYNSSLVVLAWKNVTELADGPTL
jgi:hypothetical protein